MGHKQSMDTEQRQLIADTICNEWETLEEGDDLKSLDLHQRLVDEGMELNSRELMNFLDEMATHNLVSQVRHLGMHGRITGVSPDLCDYPLNY